MRAVVRDLQHAAAFLQSVADERQTVSLDYDSGRWTYMAETWAERVQEIGYGIEDMLGPVYDREGNPAVKTASFTVHADVRQSARWKQAAEAEGFPSVGAWRAGAADAYLKVRAKAGLPVPLAWRKGRFRVELKEGPRQVSGHVSPPFGQFCGTPAGIRAYSGAHRHSLVYVPCG